ncbi:MAG TPA: hypothetical protein VMS43_04890 [Allosphingosinicella sp.]|nr:hypothetical protein [Allosphingosinicella sp.]
MTRRNYMLAALLAAAPAVALAQRPAAAPPPRPETFEALIRCRSIAEADARLQCFDAAAAALQSAQERREVVVVDRAQVREGRRRLFGLALPRIPIFGGGDDDDEDDADRVTTVEGVVASASQDSLGHWVVVLQDGAAWVQADNRPLALRPRPGQRVVINRAALGSFMMRVNNQPGIRVRRTR